MRALFRRFRADQRGNIAMLFSATSVLGILCCTLAIDEGALYLDRRQAQAAADLAAITAVRNPANSFAIARQVLIDAGMLDAALTPAQLQASGNPVRLRVTNGSYSPDPLLAPAQRFFAQGQAVNAVRVEFSRPGQLFFGTNFVRTPELGVAAMASAEPFVSVSVGSRLLSLKEGLANAVLNALLGSSLSLSAVSYNALLNAKISLFPFLDALAQEMGVTAGSYDDLLRMKADHGQIAGALAKGLNGAEATAAQALAAALGGNGEVVLGKLFGLGDLGRLQIGTGDGATLGMAKLSALDILSASAALSDGTHQVALNLGASVPGLTSLTARLAVGEPAQGATWFGIGPSGTIVRTAQVRLKFVAEIGGGLVLLNAGIRVPLYLELASAEAGVHSATCPSGGAANGSAVIAVRPAVAKLVLGEVGSGGFDNFAAPLTVSPAVMVNLDLLLTKLKVVGAAQAEVADPAPVLLGFSPGEITAGTVKTAHVTGFTTGLTQTLADNLTLTVTLLGIGLPTEALVKSTVKLLVAPLAPVLDATLTALLDGLGLSLGEADVRVYAVTCRTPRLVG